ncbi:MAG: hypothetical protein HQ559_14605 [Lentisphaerae bacterium]|nr:hypothetical protein [Lentisphaerota bacterium]
MRSHRKEGKSRAGAALFVVVGVIFVASAMMAIGVSMGMNRVFVARRMADQVKALAYAEAGANSAYGILSTNFELRTNSALFPLTSYGDGTYDVTVTSLTNSMAVIRCTGTCAKAVSTVILDVMDYGTDMAGFDETAFEYAMICGGTLTFRGCGNLSSTNGAVRLHANGLMDVRGNASTDVSIESSTKIKIGNNKTIDGDVTAPDLQYNPGKVTITGTASEEPVPLVPIPDIDLTPYYNWANDHGEVHNGFSFSGASYTPNGGILWVNGDVHISSHAVINGSIIATGDVNISGAADVNPSISAFGLVSRDGDIQNTSSGTIEGLIYTKTGDYSHTANGMVNGQIIIKGNIDKAGTSDALVYSSVVPIPPGDGANDRVIGVTAWQR